MKELVSQYREDVRKALSVGTQEGEPSDSEVEQHVRNSFSDALDRHLRPGEAAEVRMDSL